MFTLSHRQQGQHPIVQCDLSVIVMKGERIKLEWTEKHTQDTKYNPRKIIK